MLKRALNRAHIAQQPQKITVRGNPLDAQAGIESSVAESRTSARNAAIHSMLKRALNPAAPRS